MQRELVRLHNAITSYRAEHKGVCLGVHAAIGDVLIALGFTLATSANACTVPTTISGAQIAAAHRIAQERRDALLPAYNGIETMPAICALIRVISANRLTAEEFNRIRSN